MLNISVLMNQLLFTEFMICIISRHHSFADNVYISDISMLKKLQFRPLDLIHVFERDIGTCNRNIKTCQNFYIVTSTTLYIQDWVGYEIMFFLNQDLTVVELQSLIQIQFFIRINLSFVNFWWYNPSFNS